MKIFKLTLYTICLLTLLSVSVSASSITYTTLTEQVQPTDTPVRIGYLKIDRHNGFLGTGPKSNITINELTINNQYNYFNFTLINDDNSIQITPFNLTQDIEYYFMTASVTHGFAASSHNLILLVNYTDDNESKNVSIPLHIEVPAFPDFTVTQLNTTVNIDVGASAYIDLFTIDNTGNQYFDVDFIVNSTNSNFTDLIDYSDTVKVYPNLDNKVTVKLSVPDYFMSGAYNTSIIIGNSLKQLNYTVQFNVIDSLPPIISNVNHTEPYLLLDNIITATITDNLGVQQVNIDIFKHYTTNRTAIINNVTQVIVDVHNDKIGSYAMNNLLNTDTYQYNLKDLTTISTIIYNITAIDFDDNIVIVTNNFTTKLLDAVNTPDTIVFDKIRYGFGSELVGFTLHYNTPVTFKIVDIYPENINFTFKVIMPDQTERYIDQTNPNTTLAFDKKGNYTFRLKSDSIGEVHGSVQVIVDSTTHVSVPATVFSAEFVNYTVPALHSEYATACSTIICDHIDNGIFAERETNCKMRLWDECINPEKILTGETVEQREITKAQYEKELKNLDDMVLFRNSVIISIVLLLILFMVYTGIKHRIDDGLLFYFED